MCANSFTVATDQHASIIIPTKWLSDHSAILTVEADNTKSSIVMNTNCADNSLYL